MGCTIQIFPNYVSMKVSKHTIAYSNGFLPDKKRSPKDEAEAQKPWINAFQRGFSPFIPS